MDINERIFNLVQEAFDDLENHEIALSSVIRKAMRIANLRNDSKNLAWLKLNIIDVLPDNKKQVLSLNVALEDMEEYIHYREIYASPDDFNATKREKKVFMKGIPEIENTINRLKSEIDRENPISVKEKDELFKLSLYLDEYTLIIKKLENKVHEFLSNTEKQISYEKINEDIFEKNRQYVNSKLNLIAPEVLEKFISAYNRLNERNMESRSQALLSCRRILKSVADNLYPPSKEPVICADGKRRKLTDDKYINRLLQFVNENSKGSAEKDVLLAQITDLGNRLKNIDSLASKGVHDDVSEYEVNQCVIQTYLLIGDILHLTE